MQLQLILVIFGLVLSEVSGSSEPLMDILKNFDKETGITDLCSHQLTVLRDSIESDQIWALKGEKIFQEMKFN